ncbi:hypothetical protein [Subtercola lobariae]|uniref:Uncharacterized protein n=1 Tax=Subtercola lobariae TaxID=1588641 RepID=A0A917B801_9MICO|nr:hypothetical protein [Subtercola lobariae]GGF30330.1 hypothetical protein GCM10011399_24380 [Subtercola lobariae]
MAQMVRPKRSPRSGVPPVRLFDAPVRVPSGRATALIVTFATWALLVVTVPLYFVFLLNNLPDVFAIVGNMRAPRAPRGSGESAGPPDDAPRPPTDG